MADLVCVAFDDPTTADRALTELTALQKEYVIELKDACVVVRSPDGEVHLHQAMPLVRSGALAGGTSGALWGTLIGLLFLNPLASQLDAVLSRIDADLDAALERLFGLLRIKSISTDPAYAADCRACADWHVEDLSIEFEASAHTTPGHPIVVGHAR